MIGLNFSDSRVKVEFTNVASSRHAYINIVNGIRVAGDVVEFPHEDASKNVFRRIRFLYVTL